MIMHEYMHTFHFEHRPAKVSIIPGTSVLGGVTLKVLSPDVHSALLDIFATEGLDVPSGSLTTFYRLEKNGTIFYSRQYQRIKKEQLHHQLSPFF